MKSKFLLIFILVLAVSSISVLSMSEWTIMVFLNADNDLERFGIKDFLDMEKIGSTKDVNIIVQFDRANGYDTTNGNWTDTRIFKVEKSSNNNLITTKPLKVLGEIDMGDWREAVKFFNYSVDNFPARRYMFVYWNHGDGWMKEAKEEIAVKGISHDEQSGNHIDSVGMKKAAESMYRKLGRKVDIIAFDACLMGMIEVAAQHADYVQYMVASQDVEPGDGWPYDYVLKAITENPRMSTVNFGKKIVDEYMRYYENQSGFWGPQAVTQAFYELSKTSQVVQAVDRFARHIYQNMDKEFRNIEHGINYAQKYEAPFYKDLHHFVDRVGAMSIDSDLKRKAEDVKKAVNNMVVHSRWQGSKVRNSNGLAVYVPKSYEYKNHYIYTDFAKNTVWDEMLLRYFERSAISRETETLSPLSKTLISLYARSIIKGENSIEDVDILNNIKEIALEIDGIILNDKNAFNVLKNSIESFKLTRTMELSHTEGDIDEGVDENVAGMISLEGNKGRPPISIIRKIIEFIPGMSYLMEMAASYGIID
ncbi:MAG: clostripain-related cysteine peptidase [Candidatus Muiribacteriota bacterium]|jgi:clostripain